MPKITIATEMDFENINDLEHYVKEHSPLSFDSKTELLKYRQTTLETDEDVTTTLTIEVED